MAGATRPSGKVTRRSAGAVVVRRFDHRWCYLLLRAFRNWDFPKGLVEPDEEPLDAALREVTEETGLESVALRWGTTWRETEPYAGGKVARYYIAESVGGEVRLPINPALGRPEHHEFRWLEFASAHRVLVPRLRSILEWAQTVVTTRADAG